MSRGRAWESVFSKSWMIWILWGDLYRPLLNLPATFLNSMVFIFPFPCYHLYYSSDSRDFLIFLIMSEPGHIYCFSYTSCPCPQQYPVNEATEPEISQPSTHPFLFCLVSVPTQLPVAHFLKVPQEFPASCIPWPSSLPLPQTICTCSLLF